ncbi:AAA domain-containing protein [Halomonas citrativorans]|uniref:AAA family ATPase n=1 Tax=Halomonas citrativorans TaxID=2742612 RepID=A0ABR9F7J2_9GAMM|nr:AAA domain-containing protein [Halomonas citrativorans]MBE0402462.1 AAA family ATPase [Halomonas citrativorans]
MHKEPAVSIYVNDEDKTGQISDWKIGWGNTWDALRLTCYFPSGKSYSWPLHECKITPTHELNEQLGLKKGSAVLSALDRAVIYGNKYIVVEYSGNSKPYVMNAGNIELFNKTTLHKEPTFEYFTTLAEARVAQAGPDDDAISNNVLRQLKKLPPYAETALHAYCHGSNQQRAPEEGFIYPFGINESQLEAVEQAFASQISLIEGPPGTGKTQTILNIIANILVRGNTVAIVSNNNAAVENVYEKLDKAGLGYLAARLGSSKKRDAFFSAPSDGPDDFPDSAPDRQEIQSDLYHLKEHLHAHNAVARLQAEIDELTIERRYLAQWQSNNSLSTLSDLEKYNLSPQKTTDLLVYLHQLGERRLGIKDRINLLLKFKILRTKHFNEWERRKSAIYGLQLHYYDKALLDKQTALTSYQEELQSAHFETLLDHLTSSSMAYLKRHLYEHIARDETFDSKSYRKRFDTFIKRYPIIGSSSHSIINSLGQGAILDYVIIDEASQQDIVPGILALGCARNLIIVGDRKQLPHIPTATGVTAPSEFYDCEKYSLLDSCVSVFEDSISVTLLKEHYRCHPRIIQFCNQQFYDNQLIPMTQDRNEKALTLLETAKGNHARNNANLRELDSLLKTLEWNEESEGKSEGSKGFIAPYNAQVSLSQNLLPAEFVKNTVHKFQGRECDEIVFSTVLDKKQGSQKNLGFVDDPHLINVAVSRAKNKFTLVTGDDVFTANNAHIAALTRYIKYYADETQIHRAPVISAFDLLYEEYDRSLERLNGRLQASDSSFKSEQIVARLLRDTLSITMYQAMTFHSQIALIQLASLTNETLTAREIDFMRNRASCDFVIYYRVGKTPLGVIEIDGGQHDSPLQAERDALKNSILKKSNVHILRLRTNESHIEERIEKFLATWMHSSEKAL